MLQIAEGGYSFVFLVEEVHAGVPVEGSEYALKRVCASYIFSERIQCTVELLELVYMLISADLGLIFTRESI